MNYKQLSEYYRNMENKNVQSSTHIVRVEGQNQENIRINELCQSVNKRYETIINHIKNSQKIQSYIEEINIKPQVIIQSFNFIINSNGKLVLSSSGNKLIKDSVVFYFQTTIEFLDSKDANELDEKGKATWYLQVEIKLHIIAAQLFNFKTQHDITNSTREEYAKVWDKITIFPAKNLAKMKKEFKSLKRSLHLITAAMLTEQNYGLSLIKKMAFGLSCSKYLIMNDSAKLKSFIFYRNPEIKLAQTIWNMPEMGAIKHLNKLAFQGIQTNLKMYIPADGKFDPNIDIFEERPDTILVRLLYNKKIIQYPTQQRSGCCVSAIKNVKYIQKVMIHLHGGGFIALSSRSTQNYTRKWANQLGIPIFSVDYRMPPTHPFPQAPQDCLTAYRFLMNHIDHYLNVKISKVFITGDSAGGNLACVLTGMILKYHSQVTIGGLYIAYPAADLRRLYTHSRLFSIADPLLWPKTLKLCTDSYLNRDEQKSYEQKSYDPFASPVLLTEQFVSGAIGDKRFPLKWPKTMVAVGNKDPLYDDSLVLMQKMVQSNIDCQCFVYDGFSHGFLSLEMLIEQSGKTLSDSINHLKRLIDFQQSKQ